MLESFDAKLARIGGQRRAILASHRDERREVGAPARQILGELEAGARRGAVGIHGIIQQAETVLVTHLLVLAADVGDLARRAAVGMGALEALVAAGACDAFGQRR